MKVKKLLLVAIAAVTGFVSYGQDARKASRKSEKKERINALVKLEEENEPAFNRQSVFGAKLNSDGYGVSYEFGRYKTAKKTTLYMFEFNEKFHPKEEKQTAGVDYNTGNITQYKFGKANNFYQFKLGYGQQRLIGGKANKNGVSVSSIYAGGLSVGLLKPYYVDIFYNNESYEYKFTDPYPTGATQGNITGSSGITKGWGELKVKPGVHAKAALRFDYGRFNEMVSAVEAGLNAEYYASDILQMTYNKAGGNFEKSYKLFFNAYIAFHFGRRK
jgi:hypothetical protein